MNTYYTDEINTLVLISLLRKHGIKKIIASPGTTNVSFVGSIQIDPYFEIYSAIDERAAAFMACGLAEESGEPVVLTCTGATASRNYIPGLTEAYYRHLPILAVTSTQHEGKIGNYVAQVIDRSQPFNDLVKKSISLPTVRCEEDKEYTVTAVNDALLELTHGISGPVHINLVTTYSNGFTVKTLPDCRVIRRIHHHDTFPDLPKGSIGIFVGAHEAFTEEETEAMDAFCASNNAVVISDHIGNYRGKYRFLASLVNSQAVDFGTKKFDLIVYIGSVHGAYIDFSGKELWRINRDGVIRDPYRNLTYVFEMEEQDFFRHYANSNVNNIIWNKCDNASRRLRRKLPELPFSNMWIAKETAGMIPKHSVVHLSILNTLRVWNYFEMQENILCYSNSGGYGIDGCLSSFLGSAMTNKEVKHYMIIGDLSFFYDINTMLNEITSNVHIMLINNGIGTEFKNYNHRVAYFGENANPYMAAKGHNGYRDTSLLRTLCEGIGVKYISAQNKDEFLNHRDTWLYSVGQPVLFEIFTNDRDESDALQLMNQIEWDSSLKATLKNSKAWQFARKVIKGG